MSIWINRTLATLALAGLSACAGLDLAGASRAVLVQGGDIKVAPPAGYCADPKASSDSSGSAVVLMGRCAAGSSTLSALITASVGGAGSGAALDAGPDALIAFFSSDQGRGMLASTGRAADAVVGTSQTEDATVLLLIKDVNLGEYWRAILALKGRLVMLSATGAQSVSLAPQDGRALLVKAIASLRRANPENREEKAGGLFGLPAPVDPAVETLKKAPAAIGLRPKPRAPISG